MTAAQKPLSSVLATCFTALPAYAGDPGDAAVLDAADKAFTERLNAIRTSAPKDQDTLVQLEAAAALAVAAAAARARAPAW